MGSDTIVPEAPQRNRQATPPKMPMEKVQVVQARTEHRSEAKTHAPGRVEQGLVLLEFSGYV